METKMPEKWDTDLADVCFVSGDYAKAVNGIDARRIVDQRNADVEAAFAAGYANGFQTCLDQARFKVEAATEPAQPAPMNATEQMIWGQVYAAVYAVNWSDPLVQREAQMQADAAIAAANKAIGGGK
jgi:hypothetical protein